MERNRRAGRPEQAGHPTRTAHLTLGDGGEIFGEALLVPVDGRVDSRVPGRHGAAVSRAKGGDQQNDRGRHDQDSSHGMNLAFVESLPTVA